MERLRHLSAIQEEITADTNRALVGRRDTVLVDQVEEGISIGRSHRQAPEIDGVVSLDDGKPGSWVDVEYTGAYGTDLEGVLV